MFNVYCDECGKLLFTSDTNNKGVNGARAQDMGFIYKNACLFSDKYTSLYFCGDECYKTFYKRNIPQNKEVAAAIEDLKKDIPTMAKEVGVKMDKLMKFLNKK